MYSLPTIVTVNGVEYEITNRADFRVILDILMVLDDESLSELEKRVAILIIFYGEDNIPPDGEEATKEVFRFINCYDDSIGHKTQTKVMSWKQDSQMIIAGVNRVAGQDVRALPYYHWFSFIANFMEIGESQLSFVCGIRNKIATGKKLEKHEKEFKNRNPQYFVWKRDEDAVEREKNEIAQMFKL